MERRAEALYDGITGVRDDLVLDAAAPLAKRGKGKRLWVRMGALAACLCLSVAGVIGLQGFLRCGSSGENGTLGGFNGRFQSYAGPVLPLTARTGGEKITAKREVTFDFTAARSDGESSAPDGDCQVTDSYLLAADGVGQTAELLYPFVSTVRSLEETQPEVTADGGTVEVLLAVGGGSDYGVEDWTTYQELFQDSSYQASALEEPDLSQAAVVYELTEVAGPETEGGATTLALTIPEQESMTVLSYGFDGYEQREDGTTRYSLFVPQEGELRQKLLLIFLGGEPENYTITGYENGACRAGEEVAGVTAAVTRRETTLGDVLGEATEDYARLMELEAQETVLYQAAAKELAAGMGDDWYGRLDDVLMAAGTQRRVFYLSWRQEVPAGETVKVAVTYWREASRNFGGGGGDTAVRGYDLVTRLGSSLTFTGQSARIVDGGLVDIVEQNFGFDLGQGIKKAALELDQDHYYLAVRRSENQ